jgi:hypothetical protein
MTSYERYETIKKEFPSILKECLGMITTACSKAGISHETYYRWCRESEEFKAACKEAETITGYVVKDKLLKRIIDEDTTAIIYYCKTKLRDEGFAERIEHTGRDDKPIQHEHTFDITKYSKEAIDALVRIKSEG